MKLKHILQLVAALLIPVISQATDFPTRPIKLVVPFAVGGPNDVVARLIQEPLSRALGQPVIVENRIGAAGTIGMTYVKDAKPDGYTLLVGGSTPVIAALMQKKPPYDVERDFIQVALFGTSPMILLSHPSLPVKTLGELVAYAKANPGVVNFGMTGRGSISHLGTELFSQKAGIRMKDIPYGGGAPAVEALLKGEIHLYMTSPTDTISQYVSSGRLLALAVASSKSVATFPKTPTIDATVSGVNVEIWYGLQAPAGTPPDTVAKIEKAVAAITSAPQWKDKVRASLGIETAGFTQKQFEDFYKAEIDTWRAVARKGGLIED